MSSVRRPQPRVSPARATAFAVLRRVFEQGAYADRAFAAQAAGLEPRDRALAMQIAYGTTQRRDTLDHVAAGLVRGRLAELEPPVLAALRMGMFQLLYLQGIPDHAAVGESVELAKRRSPGGARLVNAVLRRAAREGKGLLGALHDDDPEGAAVLHSVPRWLAEMWWSELGASRARSLLRSINLPAESALRVNLLVSTVAQVSAALPVAHRPAPGLPEGLVLEEPLDVQSHPLWERGAIMAQSRASMLVARVLAPAGGDRVLDLCAAPGAKTTHLAALMGGNGNVLAIERHPGRAAALERTCRRMQAGNVAVQVADAVRLHTGREDLLGAFDRVLVDPPCSGLGTLRSRPDLRWRARPGGIRELAELQGQLLRAGAAATRPGGCLVYSVCTISQAEGTEVVEAFLRSGGEFTPEPLGDEFPEWAHSHRARYLQLLPDQDGTDGFFMARLRRSDDGAR
ncbi:MAG TPA: 16S rRNA (cytosine(967)-C(5))-methyltransferase RsmB [Solirubrobacteraceae bacterium]|nr:16S rRNA (cytosine(967)-C(5))-methyltransferase RsmB [Solirubrobacteraceae bacterium]